MTKPNVQEQNRFTINLYANLLGNALAMKSIQIARNSSSLFIAGLIVTLTFNVISFIIKAAFVPFIILVMFFAFGFIFIAICYEIYVGSKEETTNYQEEKEKLYLLEEQFNKGKFCRLSLRMISNTEYNDLKDYYEGKKTFDQLKW